LQKSVLFYQKILQRNVCFLYDFCIISARDFIEKGTIFGEKQYGILLKTHKKIAEIVSLKGGFRNLIYNESACDVMRRL